MFLKTAISPERGKERVKMKLRANGKRARTRNIGARKDNVFNPAAGLKGRDVSYSEVVPGNVSQLPHKHRRHPGRERTFHFCLLHVHDLQRLCSVEDGDIA